MNTMEEVCYISNESDLLKFEKDISPDLPEQVEYEYEPDIFTDPEQISDRERFVTCEHVVNLLRLAGVNRERRIQILERMIPYLELEPSHRSLLFVALETQEELELVTQLLWSTEKSKENSLDQDSRDVELIIDKIKLSVMECELKLINKFGETIGQKACSAFDTLTNCDRYLSPSRPCRVFLVGRTGSAKSSLINAIVGKRVAAIGTHKPQTKTVAEYFVPECNVTFYDTRGLGESRSLWKRDPAEADLTQAMIDHPPDIILLCFTRYHTRDSGSGLKELISSVNRSKMKAMGNVQCPTVAVLTKMDENSELDMDDLKSKDPDRVNECILQLESEASETMSFSKKTFFGSLPDDIRTAAVYTKDQKSFSTNLGVDTLLDIIAQDVGLECQIRDNNLTRIVHFRRVMAAKIIAAFTAINAALGCVPFVGAFSSQVTVQMMLNMLSALSISQERSVAKYEKLNKYTNMATGALRLTISVVTLSLWCSGIATYGLGLVFGLGIGMTAGAALTQTIGWHSYHYFTNDDLSKTHKSLRRRNSQSLKTLSETVELLEGESTSSNSSEVQSQP